MSGNSTILKVFQLVLPLFVVACMTDYKRQEHRAVYDEAALKDFVFATSEPDKAKSLHVLDSVLTDALKDSVVFFQTVAFLEKPFGDPNSPHRNEDLYIGLLQAKMKSQWCDSVTKDKASIELSLRMQNRPGSVVNNFTYTTIAGSKKKMFDVRADYTLLFFYNPECQACKDVKERLVNSEIIQLKVKSEELKILAVYTDKDETVWRNHLSEMPFEWIHGIDKDEYLYKNKVYDLRAIPTLYLLDRDKRVLLKDCVGIGMIEERLGIRQHSIKK